MKKLYLGPIHLINIELLWNTLDPHPNAPTGSSFSRLLPRASLLIIIQF